MSHKSLDFTNFGIPLGTVVNMVLPAKSKIRNNYILVWEKAKSGQVQLNLNLFPMVGLGDTLSRIASRTTIHRKPFKRTNVPRTHIPNADEFLNSHYISLCINNGNEIPQKMECEWSSFTVEHLVSFD